MADLFPKTATDLLIDTTRYKEGRMTKTEIQKRWQGMQWSTKGLRDWAAWVWKDGVK